MSQQFFEFHSQTQLCLSYLPQWHLASVRADLHRALTLLASKQMWLMDLCQICLKHKVGSGISRCDAETHVLDPCSGGLHWLSQGYQQLKKREQIWKHLITIKQNRFIKEWKACSETTAFHILGFRVIWSFKNSLEGYGQNTQHLSSLLYSCFWGGHAVLPPSDVAKECSDTPAIYLYDEGGSCWNLWSWIITFSSIHLLPKQNKTMSDCPCSSFVNCNPP